MTATTPISPSAAAPMQSQQAVEPIQNNPTAEQKLMEYIARFQAQGLASAQHLGNPAAISGEALKSLKGYFERATSLQDKARAKEKVMSNQGDDTTTLTASSLPNLPAGPASNPFEPASNVGAVREIGEKTESMSIAQLQRVMDSMWEMMRFSMETSMITSATGNISKSVSSLTRGQ